MNKYQRFQSLHRDNRPLLLPNAWDVISAKILGQTDYPAIATTSYGVANAHGYHDGEHISFDQFLNSRDIVKAVEVPISIDVESGFAHSPKAIVENILKIADTGAVRINIEDSLKEERALRPVQLQQEIISGIRHSLDANGHRDFFINARIDTYIQGKGAFETIARAKAYVESGVNGVFVPCLHQADEIKQIVKAIDAPLTVIALPNLTNLEHLTLLGVKRYSIGNALSDAVIAYTEKLAMEVRDSRNSAVLFEHAKVETIFGNNR
ncbi:isocitrate lyase/PEP mutase family protein [Ulvibacterium sp.]|uniref:isocitrate lyase/PEP mutase family protein n=1 Tax=Ulvibacterium sp. TaxID=2665914 RepID=UPI003BA895B7